MSQTFAMPPDGPDDPPGVAPALDGRNRFTVRAENQGGSTDWMARGACRESDPELFFPISVVASAVEQVNSAKVVCGRCEVGRHCLSYALRTMPHGIWGGTTREERIAVRARLAGRAPRQAE